MSRICTACACEDRDAVEASIVRGAPIRRIAEDHGLSESALRRRAAEHLPAALADAERLLAELLGLQAKALELVARAESEGDVRAAVVALREARECVALRAKVATELRREESVSVPEARAQVLRVEYAHPRALGDLTQAARQESAPSRFDAARVAELLSRVGALEGAKRPGDE